MTNQLLFSIFSFCAINSYAAIGLSPLENSTEQGYSYVVSLHLLPVGTLYQVTCNIEANSGSEKVMLEPHFLASTPYNQARLNNQILMNNSGNVQAGENLLSFQVVVQNEDSEQYNRFLLSEANGAPLKINYCSAEEIKTLTKTRPAQTQSSINGGYFFAYNDTNRPVTVAVGDVFPTSYYIQPSSWRTVFVSTNNQNIHIKEIH